MELVEVTAQLQAGPDGTSEVVYTSEEFEALMNNFGELYRWIAEAKDQLEYYRGAK